MQPHLARLTMVRQALTAWDLPSSSLKLIQLGENAIYRVDTPAGRFIARLSGAGLQTPLSVRGEMRMIEHCAQHGVHVARPVPVRTGDWLHLTPDLEFPAIDAAPRIVTLFHYAPGRRVSLNRINEDFTFRWGASIARMQLALESFLHTPEAARLLWHNVIFQGGPLASELAAVDWLRREWEACAAWLENLPLEHFGLIHADAHEGNFKVHDGKLWFFDFDDACIIWRVYDLAVIALRFERAGDAGRSRAQQQALIAGYTSLIPLSDLWQQRIYSFQRVRRIWALAWLNLRRAEVPRLARYYETFFAEVRQHTATAPEPLV